jgi:hypothetical protein
MQKDPEKDSVLAYVLADRRYAAIDLPMAKHGYQVQANDLCSRAMFLAWPSRLKSSTLAS